MKRPIEIPGPRPDCNAAIDKPCTEVDTSGGRHTLIGFHAERVMLTRKVEVKEK
jgi:hypothetical protein